MSGLLVFGRTGQVARELQQLGPVFWHWGAMRPIWHSPAPVLRPSTPTAPAR